MKTISYTYISGDIFHYGHLLLLKKARKSADYHICGLLSDKLCQDWNGSLIMKYDEREAILKDLNCVDEVMEQSEIDPTPNLKKIHEIYKHSKIVLFQGHQEWKGMPGSLFVKSIGGDVIKPDYYPRLARSAIKEELNRSGDLSTIDIESYLLGDISYYSLYNSTKADTLVSLKPKLKKSAIEKIFVFTKSQWTSSEHGILEQIKKIFKNEIVVRSSSLIEDSSSCSYAGFFHSELNVDSEDDQEIKTAIAKVINSFSKHEANSPRDQILVQSQTSNVAYSGVVFTRNIQNSSPYYVINFDKSSKTDTVTSGQAGNKLEVLKNVEASELQYPWQGLVEAVREIEELLHNLALDIEFAIKENGEIVIFQIRPLAAGQKFSDIPDLKIFKTVNRLIKQYKDHAEKSLDSPNYSLSDMSFWNPAEIIGDRPDNLSYSIYQYLILNNAWNSGLVPLGYKKVDRPLMVRIGNKPYIELETSFRALLPADLNESLTRRLIQFYREKLKRHPELHDKIEFQLVHNCYTPTTEDQLRELKVSFSDDDIDCFRQSLIVLTQTIFNNYESQIGKDLGSLKILSERRIRNTDQTNSNSIKEKALLALELLDDATELGAIPFARVARLAFIGNQYLKGFVAKKVVSEESVDHFLASIKTVASELNEDFNNVLANDLSITDFLGSYGHLRPGTYDITKLPYYKNPDYFKLNRSSRIDRANEESEHFFNKEMFIKGIDHFLNSYAISISSEKLLWFISETTKLRELFKFEFTVNLSMALEIIADVGQQLGFSREELSGLSVQNLKGISASSAHDIAEQWYSQIIGRKIVEEIYKYLEMPSLVFSWSDFKIIQSHLVLPNYITQKVVTAEIIDVESISADEYNSVENRIVLLEKADPGYDWIFSKSIAGLITKYGGVASHMAIRCAEFKTPAVIGCGEIRFKELKKKKIVHIDCGNKLLNYIR